MARGSQTFSVSLSLLTGQFKKGVKTIQTSLNNLKMQFRSFAGALGAGLGLSEIARNMVDSARKLDKAQAVLKNVSGGVAAYADNQEFVLGLSKKYNQELTTLIANYAKYHATANQANVPLEEQKYIYESLTRASAYFNLSADETNGVMLAITQMMSKGRVSSEELRRQLGERLPGAMGLMAKAMNVSNAELENMLKRGELLAVEALPRFAKELNKVTQNLDVDTIEGASNKLRNAFTNLTTKLNVGNIYKGMINGVSNGLEYITENLRKVAEAIVAVLGTIAAKPMIQGAVNSWNTFFNGMEDKVKTIEKRMDYLRDKAHITAGAHGIRIDANTLQPYPPAPTDKEGIKAWAKLKQYADEFGDLQKDLTKNQNELNNKFGTMAKKLGASVMNLLKVAGIQAMYYAIAAAISVIITKVVSWAKEQKRIKNLVKDTNAEIDKLANKVSEQETSLSTALSVYNDKDASDADRENALKRINELLGLEEKAAFTLESAQEAVNKAVEDRLALIKKEQEYQARLAKQTELNDRKKDLENEKTANEEKISELKNQIENAPDKQTKMQRASTSNNLEARNKQIDEELEKLAEIIADNAEALKPLELSASDRRAELNKSSIGNTGTGGVKDPDTESLEKQYKEIQEEYNSNLRSLNEQKKHELITEEEYQKELEDLTLKTAQSILALNDIDENTDTFARTVLDAAKSFIANAEKEDKVQEALDEYHKELQTLYNQFKNGAITQEELTEALESLKTETLKTLASFGNLSGAAQSVAEQLKASKQFASNLEALDIENPTVGNRDTTFDYNKSNSEKYDEWAQIYREYEDELRNTIEQLDSIDPTPEIIERLASLDEELERCVANAITFEEAMKLAKVSEDVKNLKEAMDEGIYNGITNIADAADRLTRSVETLFETMEDPDATAWEKILGIMNAITQVTDTILQSVQMIQTLAETMDKLKQAEAAYQAVQAAGTAQAVAGAATTVVAKEAEATASGTAEAAKMPFPANILAIAGIVGMIAAIFASLPKFAHGGIVGGNSTIGDHNLIRANAGEMILNPQQQSTLFNMLNGNSSPMGRSGGNVEFKIRGSELVGVLKNHNNRLKG